MKIVYGPVHPVIEKEGKVGIDFPPEEAKEKKVIKHIDLQKEWEEFIESQNNTHLVEKAKKVARDKNVIEHIEFLELQANTHIVEKSKKGIIERRLSKDGEVLTQKEHREDEGMEH